MKRINLADQTLRLRGEALSFKEKLELARELERAGVDVIEAAAIQDEQADALLIRTLASLLRDAAVSVPAGLTEAEAQRAWAALQKARKPRLLVSVPVSPVGMEYSCGMKAPKLLECVRQQVARCAALCADVEFCAQDATRAEEEFLLQVLKAAVEAGAKTVTVCDSACLFLPEELAAFVGALREKLQLPEGVCLSVEASDGMGMGAACAFSAAREGAGELKTAVGAAMPELGTVAQVLRSRGDHLQLRSGLDMTGIQRCLQNIGALFVSEGRHRKSPAGNVNPEADSLSLTAEADMDAVSAAVRALGYELGAEDLARVLEAVHRIAQAKPVTARELDAIVADSAQQVPATYRLVRYVVNSGNVISATAHVELEKDGSIFSGLSTGDGPIDAAFMAIEQLVGHHYELDDFQIQSVTEGREAMGRTLVKLRDRGMLYSGEGLSTDIIAAAIHAYLNALNKIVYEGKRA